jgi:hypothetical protein
MERSTRDDEEKELKLGNKFRIHRYIYQTRLQSKTMETYQKKLQAGLVAPYIYNRCLNCIGTSYYDADM